MTEGHRHRTLKVRKGGRIERLLRRHLVETVDAGRATRSRWTWGRITPDEPDYPVELRLFALYPDVFVLTPLGVLHTLFGLTLIVDPNGGDGDDFAGERCPITRRGHCHLQGIRFNARACEDGCDLTKWETP